MCDNALFEVINRDKNVVNAISKKFVDIIIDYSLITDAGNTRNSPYPRL